MKKFQFPKRAPKTGDGRVFKNGTAAMAVLALVAVVLVNLLVNALPSQTTQFDLSDSGLYSLSDATKQMLEEIDQDVNLYYLAQTGSEDPMAILQEIAGHMAPGAPYACIPDRYEAIQAAVRMAQPGVPTVEEWLADRMPAGGTLALDGACTSVSVVESLEKALAEKRAVLRDHDFVSALWQEGRPPIPATEAWLLEPSRAGLSAGGAEALCGDGRTAGRRPV